MNHHLKSLLTDLPKTPGVYQFKNQSGNIIYIGKAIRLRSRVQSYFRPNVSLNAAKRAMIQEIYDIAILPCESEIEALILEAQLIKKHDPYYNVLLKDDKSYAYLAWTKEKFPRLFVTYQSYVDKHKQDLDYLGPFVNSDALRTTLRILRKIFPYRSCRKLPTKPCIYYKLGLCDAPCISNITYSQYRGNLHHIIEFMKGNKKGVVKQLTHTMQEASEAYNFERAAEIRDQIQSLEKVALHKGVIKTRRSQKIKYLEELQSVFNLDKLPKRIEGFDSSHFHGDQAVVSMVVFEHGRPKKDQYRRFKIKLPPTGGNDFYNLEEALQRRFAHKDWPIPDLILIDGGKGQLSTAIQAQKNGLIQYRSIPIISLAKRLEEIYTPHTPDPILIPRSSKALQILQQVRDESHRFAVTYHRLLRSKHLLPKKS